MATAELMPGSEDPVAGIASFPASGLGEQPRLIHPVEASRDAPAADGLPVPVPAPSLPADGLRKLSILMPVYNEENTIAQAVSEILRASYPCDFELIIVDDGSTDGTASLLASFSHPQVRVCRHGANRGKGAAIMTAVSLATGTHVLPFDADLEYSADDIARVVMPVLSGRVRVVYGTRLFGVNTVYRSYRYALGNRLLSNLANVLFNAWITDLHTCFKLIPVALMRDMNLRERGFGLDTEVTALLLREGIRPFEVPVSYYARSHAQGKKITWRDGVICARVLLSVRLRTRSQLRMSGNQPAALAADEPDLASADPILAGPASSADVMCDGGDGFTVSMGRHGNGTSPQHGRSGRR